MAKITFRIPTKEPYSYVEIEREDSSDLTPEEIKVAYDELTSIFQGSEGIPEITFHEYLIKLANSDLTEWGDSDGYEAMNDSQKKVAQAFKRFYKRLPNE